ncbi:MAG: saccharopine dehydrogenase family protein, partial [Stenotrophobium sp.]
QARAFALDDAAGVARNLAGYTLLLNCAGPFAGTAETVMRACIQERVHYLDITGEIPVFELAQRLSDEAAQAGVLLCPGVGMDVVPSDCLAATLKQALPDAVELALAFKVTAPPSGGSLQTMIEGMASGCMVRKNGVIVTVPFGSLRRRIDFGQGAQWSLAIPWGDVSTAYASTGIPNIAVYTPVPGFLHRPLRAVEPFRAMAGLAPVQRTLKTLAGLYRGPSAQRRQAGPTFFWGEVRNAGGETRQARLKTESSQGFTAKSAITVARELLAMPKVDSGARTPTQLLGSGLIACVPDCAPIELLPPTSRAERQTSPS